MEKVPSQMTVIGISKPGGPEVLLPETRPVPMPAANEILIKVAAAGVNRPDVAQRSGSYPPPPGASDLPGLEVAGEVVALGAGSHKHKLGDKVMSLVAGGGYAPYCIAQDAQAMAVPASLSMLEAGATPETLMTVWHNVFERGGLQPGETILIHGGSSGIGTMAIQLAKAFGSKVIVTVGSKEKADACVRLGADHAINYKTDDFVAAARSMTSGAGPNVILDMVGGDYVERNYDAAAIDGRIVQIALLGGPKATANFAKLMVKRLHHTGSTLRPRSNADKAAMVTAIEAKVMPLLRDGRVKPLMDSTFPLEKAADAHRRMETSEHIGKIVLAASTIASQAKAGNPLICFAFVSSIGTSGGAPVNGVDRGELTLRLIRCLAPPLALGLVIVAAHAGDGHRRRQRPRRRVCDRPHRGARTSTQRHRPHPGLHRARHRRHRSPHRGARPRRRPELGGVRARQQHR